MFSTNSIIFLQLPLISINSINFPLIPLFFVFFYFSFFVGKFIKHTIFKGNGWSILNLNLVSKSKLMAYKQEQGTFEKNSKFQKRLKFSKNSNFQKNVIHILLANSWLKYLAPTIRCLLPWNWVAFAAGRL